MIMIKWTIVPNAWNRLKNLTQVWKINVQEQKK